MGSMTGLAALGFWMFVAAVVVAGIWSDIRKRESQQETLRRVVESGQKIDAALIDKMVGSVKGDSHADQDLKVGGTITMSVGAGLYLLGYFVSRGDAETLRVFIGIALLVGVIGLGLIVAGIMSARWRKRDESQDQYRA
jgi:hypothetical protein